MSSYLSARIFASVALLTILSIGGYASASGAPSETTPPSTTPFPPRDDPPYFLVDSFSAPNKLKVHELPQSDVVIIDTTGLEVDVSCARQLLFSRTSLSTLRIEFLRFGCARLTTSQPIEAETKAEQEGKDNRWGLWASLPEVNGTGAPTTNSDAVGLPHTGAWVGRNLFNIVSVILALLGLSWIAKIIDNWWQRKRVDIIMTGLPGAGKTDLWIAWRDEAAPDSNSSPTSSLAESKMDPIPLGPKVLVPNVVDTAGADPASILNFMKRGRRRKRVLIFVVAPTRLNKSSSPAFDEDYILEQKGYSNLPRALIGARDRRLKPRLAIVFLTKFDLLSKSSPDDSTSASMKAQTLAKFDKIIASVESASRNNGVAFQLIVGSSRYRNWGVDILQKQVTRIVLTGRDG